MREILFKGKKKDNGEWIEGYLMDGGMPGEKRIFIGKLVIGKWTVSKISDRDKRRYKIIKDLYISKKPMKIDEISKKYSVSKVTVYEDIKIAKERLSSLFFGIDGLRIF